MNFLYKTYLRLILNPTPGRIWKAIRFVIHWGMLPVKLLVVGSTGFYQILRQELFVKERQVPPMPTDETKREYFNLILQKLPIWKTDEFHVYVPGVPYWSNPGVGRFHNTKTQTLRHGTYCFLMDRLNTRTEFHDTGLAFHVKSGQLANGFIAGKTGLRTYDLKSASTDTLAGLSLGMLTSTNRLRIENKESLENLGYGLLRDNFSHLISNMIFQDFSLLEGQVPKYPVAASLWNEYQERMEKNPFVIKEMKSTEGNCAPGFDITPVDALVALAATKVYGYCCGSYIGKKAYSDLLWRYGYGILALFPIAFTKSTRDYRRDHTSMISLYVLSKLTNSKLGKFFWKLPMLFVWYQSKKYYNGYFTGLLEDAHPGTVSKTYLDKCIAYLYETKPSNLSIDIANTFVPKELPVPFVEMNQGEFQAEMEQKYLYHPETVLTPEELQETTYHALRHFSGLGFIAHAIMLEKDPTTTLLMKEQQ